MKIKTAIFDLALSAAVAGLVVLTLTQCTHAASSYDVVTLSNNSIKTTHLIDINNVTGRATGGYALPARPHGELALTGYKVNGTKTAPHAAFLCVSSGIHPSMVKLEGDAFVRAGSHLHQSVNPLQLCHPHLTVNGKASFKVNGASNHA